MCAGQCPASVSDPDRYRGEEFRALTEGALALEAWDGCGGEICCHMRSELVRSHEELGAAMAAIGAPLPDGEPAFPEELGVLVWFEACEAGSSVVACGVSSGEDRVDLYLGVLRGCDPGAPAVRPFVLLAVPDRGAPVPGGGWCSSQSC